MKRAASISRYKLFDQLFGGTGTYKIDVETENGVYTFKNLVNSTSQNVFGIYRVIKDDKEGLGEIKRRKLNKDKQYQSYICFNGLF